MIAGSTAGVGFVPTSYGSCVLWLKADVGVATGGSNITTWSDQSGSGNDLVQGVATPTLVNAAYNGLPCARFVRGSSQYLIKTAKNLFGAGAYSIYVVCKFGAASGGTDYLFSSSATTADGNMLFITGTSRAALHAGVTAYAGGTYNPNTAELWTCTRAAASAPVLRINGSIQQLGASSTTLNDPGGTAALVLGATSASAVVGSFCTVDVMEIAAYSVARTETETSIIQKYLKTRWALP